MTLEEMSDKQKEYLGFKMWLCLIKLYCNQENINISFNMENPETRKIERFDTSKYTMNDFKSLKDIK